MGRLIDLTGQRFGRRMVIRHAGSDRHGSAQWLCLCDCGKEAVVRGSSLRRGQAQSCGCLWEPPVRITHGHTRNRERPPEFLAWDTMKARCYNPNNKQFKDYGGRGIKVCDEWRESFESFLKDVGSRPENPPDWTSRKSYWSIDRIDNDGDYEPGNVRWATPTEQVRNRRKS